MSLSVCVDIYLPPVLLLVWLREAEPQCWGLRRCSSACAHWDRDELVCAAAACSFLFLFLLCMCNPSHAHVLPMRKECVVQNKSLTSSGEVLFIWHEMLTRWLRFVGRNGKVALFFLHCNISLSLHLLPSKVVLQHLCVHLEEGRETFTSLQIVKFKIAKEVLCCPGSQISPVQVPQPLGSAHKQLLSTLALAAWRTAIYWIFKYESTQRWL